MSRLLRAAKQWPRGVRLVVGLVCLVLGVIGILIPIIPGWPLFFVALPLIVSVSPALQRIWERYLDRHPKVRARLAKERKAAAPER